MAEHADEVGPDGMQRLLRREAGIPDRVEFATKPAQAQATIGRAVAAGVPFAWLTADETYGQAKGAGAVSFLSRLFHRPVARCRICVPWQDGRRT